MGKTFKYFPIGSTIVVKASFWFNQLDNEYIFSEEFNFQAVKIRRTFSTRSGDNLREVFKKYNAADAEQFYTMYTRFLSVNEIA